MISKKILFAVLNWGLGHATRSIPLIDKLLNSGFEVIIASDGEALQLLQQEFPGLVFENLPAYNITYAGNPLFFNGHLAKQLPGLYKNIKNEQAQIEKIVKKHHINLIISDNRFGAYHSQIPSVYITHQLRVLSGITTPISTFFHRNIYKKYRQIWVPDFQGEMNLSGKLGHLSFKSSKIKYIGVLSRMQVEKLPLKYDILAILSGPEPQRSLFEKVLLEELPKLSSKVALVQGKVTAETRLKKHNGIDVYNYLKTKDLQELINQSDAIISRSGYTSVMDLYALQKKVLWVPTPGQKEQEYLAKHLLKQMKASLTTQQNFVYKNPVALKSSTTGKQEDVLDLIREL